MYNFVVITGYLFLLIRNTPVHPQTQITAIRKIIQFCANYADSLSLMQKRIVSKTAHVSPHVTLGV